MKHVHFSWPDRGGMKSGTNWVRVGFGPLSPALLDKMNRCWQAAKYPTVAQVYQCGKSMIEPRTTLDVALPPPAIGAVVFESYGEPARRMET